MPNISISKSLYALFTLVVLTFLLASCGEGTSIIGGKTVPIFQGMEIERISDKAMGFKGILLSDEEDPFYEAIEENIGVIPSDNVEFFAEPNEDILVTVKLFNPDNFVILRFTLNNVVYQSYQFEQGSDSENLIMKVNAGAMTGIREFSLDEIKYIDDTANNAIKDVIIDGDPTLNLGVTYQNLPDADVVNQNVTAFSLVLSLNVTDLDQLINVTDSRLNIYVFDGSSIIHKAPINIGSSLVRVENLKPGINYQYAIAGTYDLLDGLGNRTGILWQDIFTTSHLFDLQNISTTQSNIGADLINLTGEQGWVEKVELFDGETLLNTYTSFDNFLFPELLSNHEYTLKLMYGYSQNDSDYFAEITEKITTQAKSIPQIEIMEAMPSQDSINFDLSIVDTDEVGTITLIELYQGEILVESFSDLTIREFTDLLSNNEYTIKATYTYDLNDGIGEQTLVSQQAVTTLEKSTPTVTIDNVTTTQESIGFEVTETDVDQVGAVTAIELYQGEILVVSFSDLTIREFTDSLSNNEYTVKVTYTYDLNDGIGEQTLVSQQAVTTLEKSAPTVTIDNVTTTQESIGFEVTETDVDQVGAVTAIELYQGEILVESFSDLTSREFINLNRDTKYTLVISYEYNLNDSKGLITEKTQMEITTDIFNGKGTVNSPYVLENPEDLNYLSLTSGKYFILNNDIDLSEIEWHTLPSFIGTIDGNGHSILNVNMNIDTQDNISNFGFFESFNGELKNIIFDNVDMNISILYASNIGVIAGSFEGVLSDVALYGSINVSTISDINVGGISGVGNLSGAYKVNSYVDIYVSGNGNIYSGGLLGNGTLKTNLSNYSGKMYAQTTDGLTFIGGFIGYSWDTEIHNSYSNVDLSGTSQYEQAIGGLIGRITGAMIVSNTYTSGNIQNLQSKAYTYSGGLIGYIESDKNYLKVLKNSFSTINIIHTGYSYAGNIYGNLSGGNILISNIYRIDTQTIINGLGETFSSFDLDSLNIKTTPYDQLEDSSFYTVILVWDELLWNLGKIISTFFDPMNIKTINIYNDRFEFTLDVLKVITSAEVINIQLYQSEELVEILTDLTVREFNDLLSNNQYTIKVTYTYDLNDGIGEQTGVIEQAITTQEKSTPIVIIDNVTPTQESISFGLTITDVDQVGEASAIELYKGETLVEALTDLNLREFNELLSNNQYTIKVTYTYDLNDGTGNHEIIITTDVLTLAKEVPSAALDAFDSGQYSMQFSIEVSDPDSIYTFTKLQIIHSDLVIEEYLVSASLYDIESLLRFTSYTILVSYQYDLNDGTGTHEITDDFNVSTQYFDGKGTETNPYIIRTSEDLTYMIQLNEAFYSLNNDIDLSGVSWNAILEFKGTFDGQGYSITNMSTTNTTSTQRIYGGLFAINRGTIKNLSIVNANINLDIFHSTYVGLIAGENYGLIHESEAIGTIFIDTSSYVHAGGIAGFSSGQITNSSATVDITSYASSYQYIGGLAGSIMGLVEQSSSDGTLYVSGFGDGEINAGGLVGRMNGGTISNSYTDVDVTWDPLTLPGMIYGGAFIGKIDAYYQHVLVENSYATGDVNFYYASGFIPVAQALYNASITIKNVIALGNVHGIGQASHLFGSLFAHGGAEVLAINAYYDSNQVIMVNSIVAEAIDHGDARISVLPTPTIALETNDVTSQTISVSNHLTSIYYIAETSSSYLKVYQNGLLIKTIEIISGTASYVIISLIENTSYDYELIVTNLYSSTIVAQETFATLSNN